MSENQAGITHLNQVNRHRVIKSLEELSVPLHHGGQHFAASVVGQAALFLRQAPEMVITEAELQAIKRDSRILATRAFVKELADRGVTCRGLPVWEHELLAQTLAEEFKTLTRQRDELVTQSARSAQIIDDLQAKIALQKSALRKKVTKKAKRRS